MTMKPGEVTQVMQVGNKLVVAVVTGINPPHQAEFSEVEPAVRTNYLQLRAVDLVKEKSAQAAELLKQNGDIKAAAKAVGAEVKSTDFIGRSGAATIDTSDGQTLRQIGTGLPGGVPRRDGQDGSGHERYVFG